MIEDYKDFTIRYDGHPKYNEYKIVEDDLLNIIFQKLEMIIFTNQGDVMSDPNLGANIAFFLWKTKVPSNTIEKSINEQIIQYVPELLSLEYSVTVNLYQGSVKDIAYIIIKIKDFKITYIFD